MLWVLGHTSNQNPWEAGSSQGSLETRAADLRRDLADGKVTASEAVQLVGDVPAALSLASDAKFALVAPTLGSVQADGKVTRLEALTLALAFGG